jgi:hypothetical protein
LFLRGQLFAGIFSKYFLFFVFFLFEKLLFLPKVANIADAEIENHKKTGEIVGLIFAAKLHRINFGSKRPTIFGFRFWVHY